MRLRPFAVAAPLAATFALAALAAPARPEAPARADRYGDPLPQGAVLRLGTVRFCQPFPSSLAFTPDGKALASGGADNRVRLWAPDTGKEIRALEGHTGPVNCIALSADGKWLASGTQDHDLRLWEVATGKVRQRFRGHTAPVERLALSPDGKVLASSCFAGTLRLWDTDTGKEIRSLPIDKGYRIDALAFTPDGKRLAFNNRSDRGIQLVDVADGKVARTFLGHKDHVYELTFTPDGKSLISGGLDHTIRAWDVVSGKELRRYGDEKMAVRCLALAPDGKTLTYGTYPDGMVHVLDLAANKDLVPPWKANRWCIVSIAYSPDSKKVALGRDTIAIHETATGRRLSPAPESESHVQQVAYSADGRLLAVWRYDDTIEVWDTAQWRKAATLRAKTGRFTALAFSPAGKHLTTAEGDFNRGAICHWDARSGERLQELPRGKGWLYSLSYSADGRVLACLQVAQSGDLVLWDAATGKERRRVPYADRSGRGPRLSPDGRLLACVTSRNGVDLWDAEAGKLVRRFGTPPHGGRELLAFSPDGRAIATPGGRGMDGGISIDPDLVLWETATGKERLRIALNDGQLSHLAFSPDGRLLASAGRLLAAPGPAETIRLWDTWTGQEVGRFTGHRGWVSALAFAPDGKSLASGGADATVLIWDVAGLPAAGRGPAEPLGRDELARCWEDLAGEDAARAYRAMAELSRRPDQAEGLLRDQFAGHPGLNAERLTRLLAALDAPDFRAREKASAELAGLGRLAEGALERAREAGPSAEVRRARDLLRKLDGQPESRERARLLRAVEVLERVGTAGARRLLDKLMKEATVADVAREARGALERSGKLNGKEGPP